MMISLATNAMTTPVLKPGGASLAATMPGAEPLPFLGGAGVFDPLGLTPESQEELLMFREAELAHCRVAMVGTLGYLVQSHFAPMFSQEVATDSGTALVIRQLDLVLKSEMGQLGSSCLLLAIFFSEIYRARTGWMDPEVEMRALREDYSPGDLGFDLLGLKPQDPEAFKTMQDKELRNGRLAMIAIAGMTVQELTTGQQIF